MAEVNHILILSSWYPTKEYPFVGNFVERQAKLLSQKYTVTVVHCIPGKSKKSTEIIYSTEKGFLELFVYYRNGVRFFNFLNQKRALKKALRILPTVDLIHAHVSFPKGHLFVLAKKKLKCTLILTEHGSYYRTSVLDSWTGIQKYFTKKTLATADVIVVVSEVLKSDLQQWTKNKRIEIIGNHIDCNYFVPKEKEDSPVHFLHISTLDPIKNVKGIIDAFELLSKENTGIELTIVSDENASSYIEYASTLNSFQHIHFVGPLTWNETVQYYQQAHCFILNSEYETFSIVLAEAWSCGIPVITTNVGIGYQIPEFLGLQVDKNDVNDLAEKMGQFIQNQTQYDANKIRAFALQYDAPSILLKLQQLYEQI